MYCSTGEYSRVNHEMIKNGIISKYNLIFIIFKETSHILQKLKYHIIMTILIVIMKLLRSTNQYIFLF